MLMLASTVLASWAQSEERTSTVTFLAIDERGVALPAWKVTMFKSADQDHTNQFDGLRANRIPVSFNAYAYILTGPPVSRAPLASPWTPSASGKAWVSRSEEFVVVTVKDSELQGFSIDRVGPPFSFSIRGKLDGMRTQSNEADPVRINLHSPIPGLSDIDVLVSRTGEFQIFQALHGVWVLSVIRGGEVLHVEPVHFGQQYRSTSFVVRIESAARPLLRVQ
jgi:hypothetical protein